MARNFSPLTAAEAKKIDGKIQSAYGMSVLALMENAGRAVAEEAERKLTPQSRIVVFCGKGNNGGDGFVAARHLWARGFRPDVFLAGKKKEVKNEARVNLDILLKLNKKVFEVSDKTVGRVGRNASSSDMVIDALLGVGLSGEVHGVSRSLIQAINRSQAYILSVDIPSGLDATTGEILGCSVKADKTVTFLAPKKGMLIGSGPSHCGKVVVRDLGIPLEKLSKGRYN